MATDEMIVRVMRREDIPTLVEIDGLLSGSPRADYIAGKAEQALDSRHGMVISLVAERFGKVVGFLMGQLYHGEFGIPEGVATVDTVGVHPAAQKHGVGQLLMEELLTHVRKAGANAVRTIVDWSQWDLLSYFRHTGFAPSQLVVLERKV